MPEPEPARVYGYISLVDPDTGQLHLILDYNTDPPGSGVVLRELQFLFRLIDLTNNPATDHVVSITGPFPAVGHPPIALSYDVTMIHDRTAGGRPFRVAQVPTIQIYYNPDMWNLVSVTPGPLTGRIGTNTSSGGVTYASVTIPLTQRTEPFDNPALVALG